MFNARRELRPIREMPPKAYHLADFDAYERVCGRRWAMYTSSLACPYNCGYCTNDAVYGRKWNALDPEQASEEMCDLAKRYGLQLLWVVDDNFLVDRNRALAIAEGICERGVKFEWSIQASTNLVTRLSVDEWKLMRRAGLTQVAQGADTGSPKVMQLMNKNFQKLEMIYEAADVLTRAGVRPSFNMIFAYPGESRADQRESSEAGHGYLPRTIPARSSGPTFSRRIRALRSWSAPSSWESTCRKSWKSGRISSRATRCCRG